MRPRFLRIVLLGGAIAVAAACGATEDGRVRADGDRLEHDGVSIALQPGWEGRVLPLDYPAAVLQAANFELLPPGEIELPPGEQDPIKAMTAEHVLVNILPCGLLGTDETARPAPRQIALEELSFLPPGDALVPRGHALAHGSFDFADRCLRIEAHFGAASAPPTLTKAVDAVLLSLSVAGR